MIHFEIPKNQSSIIKVIGVGGGGGNAVNSMYNLGIEGVDFIVCNTDSQALAQSPIPNKIQLGPHLTQGLGAGANPEIGKQAGEESIDEISKILSVNTRMAFITAGMGGGTGTGGAPVIAKTCRDLGILTVGIVTTPFTYEGRKRLNQAQNGIASMREHVDTILIISNDKLRQQFGNLPFTQAFAKADNILATAAKCITDLITVDGRVNLDFNDVQTVMKSGGVAILGSAVANGESRAYTAVTEALNSPLLNDDDISGAKWILLNVTSSQGENEHTLDELDIIQGYVQDQAGNNCDIILGMGHDPSLGDNIAVTIIATGFQQNEIKDNLAAIAKAKQPAAEPEKVIVSLQQETTPLAPATPEPAPVAATPAPVVDPMAPRLIQEMVQPQPAPAPAAAAAPVTHTFELELPKTAEEPRDFIASAPQQVVTLEAAPMPVMPAPAPQAPQQASNTAADNNVKVGERYLTPDEIEERNRFEEQKRILEERAERLRRMSFNFHGNNADEIENVPAYMRRNTNTEETIDESSKPFLSSYNVNEEGRGNISTINTFLDGNKPD
ncbi:cell division protein FtsZ [Taibaiella sp. KBW10]|uniref:cell division protein FtsZ n=1 Tax=Taibaiella sp. KBW10 TaxID=2153357 RepID=UPI000F5AA839|nr:cell division protein FtsZ [Taibaiella sp. KBW10]RQO30454.1 cell division protein FtsZ [Taibaiella sp. KBW10]